MGNKLSLHINALTNTAKEQLGSQRNGRFLKILDLDRNHLLNWKSNNPNGIISFRYYINDGENSNLERWSEYADRMLTEIRNKNCSDLVNVVYVPYNETAQWREAGIKRLGEVSCMFIDKIKNSIPNIKVAVGSFSCGNPRSHSDWDEFIQTGVFTKADFLSLHRYWKWHLHSEGSKWLWDFEGLYQHFRSKKYNPPPLILGEFGIDYRLWTTDPNYYEGYKKEFSLSQYCEQLEECSVRLEGNKDVIAACVFASGSKDPTWFSYCVDFE